MAQPAGPYSNFSKRLSVQEARFVFEYIKDGNGIRSAIDSGWCDKLDKKRADDIATKILKQPRVVAAIKEQLDAVAQRTLITVDRIMQEVYRLATYNVRDAFDSTGHPIPITELPEDVSRAIEGIEVETIGGVAEVVKYKFAKKSVSQQLLLERIDNIVKRFELTGRGGAPLNPSKVDLSDVSTELLKQIVAASRKKEA